MCPQKNPRWRRWVGKGQSYGGRGPSSVQVALEWESQGGALYLCPSLWFGKQDARETCLTLLCFAPDTFWKNPQFLLSVWRPQEGKRSQLLCSVLVSLLQKPRHRHRNWKPHLAIGFYLFRVSRPLVGSYPFFLFPVLFTICLSVCPPPLTTMGANPVSVPWEYVI